MFNLLVRIVAHLLSWGFVIGMAGCVLVIPITAYKLISVLFQKDAPHELNPSGEPAPLTAKSSPVTRFL
jgi:hypothetical protein